MNVVVGVERWALQILQKTSSDAIQGALTASTKSMFLTFSKTKSSKLDPYFQTLYVPDSAAMDCLYSLYSFSIKAFMLNWNVTLDLRALAVIVGTSEQYGDSLELKLDSLFMCCIAGSSVQYKHLDGEEQEGATPCHRLSGACWSSTLNQKE